ncbi:PhzF family phenazine biosynthesis protein [Lutispora sp.]|uniref:PhzF family phenazine biosynthesis protein n=1 Tax=Lutispora sp. TaxID=2828727 RepID=UPI002B1F6558|nr:PhzF family phenazine biosynthesis protein [Lutispora sp.]MEA4964148.1 PhzF family phenazine biosynthesis protein [Lutispora sp.]
MNYAHVDVFSAQPLSGNGLTVVFINKEFDCQTLLYITQEFKQFETIFIFPQSKGGYPVRIFTVEEELNFAGHPILGASAVIHRYLYPEQEAVEIYLTVSGRKIYTKSERMQNTYNVIMDQGEPQFLLTVARENYQDIAAALNINIGDLHEEYPVEVVSTGLPYMLVPLKTNLGKNKIIIPNFEGLLNKFGAKFVYLFDPQLLECRTWDNAGNVEDVATGSAAGPLCAYLIKNGFKKLDEVINIYQGKYIGRPSLIQVWATEMESGKRIFIRGEVSFFGEGELFV